MQFFFKTVKKISFFKSNEHFFGMHRGKQSVKRDIWRIGGRYKKRKQTGEGFPVGLLASFAGPLLGEIAKPIFKKIVGGKIRPKKRIRRIRWWINKL